MAAGVEVMAAEEKDQNQAHDLTEGEHDQLEACLESLDEAWDHACLLLRMELSAQMTRGEKPNVDNTAASEILPLLLAASRTAVGWY